MNVLQEIQREAIKKKVPTIEPGLTVRVHQRIKEGEKERIQVFAGVVIAKKSGGASEAFTVYRNAYGVCMERVFLMHSPRITSVEVVRLGDVKRAKLYYIRGKTGKKAKIKEKIIKSRKKRGIQQEEKLPVVEENISVSEKLPGSEESKEN